MGGVGLLDAPTKRVMERALEGELTDHLGYEKHAREGRNSGNSRNGRTRKRVKMDTSEFEIEVPQDRDSTFDPRFVRKGQPSAARVRREGDRAVRAGHDDAGDPGSPARGLVKAAHSATVRLSPMVRDTRFLTSEENVIDMRTALDVIAAAVDQDRERLPPQPRHAEPQGGRQDRLDQDRPDAPRPVLGPAGLSCEAREIVGSSLGASGTGGGYASSGHLWPHRAGASVVNPRELPPLDGKFPAMEPRGIRRNPRAGNADRAVLIRLT